MKLINDNIQTGDYIVERKPLLNIKNKIEDTNILSVSQADSIMSFWENEDIKKAIHSSNTGLFYSLNNFNDLSKKKKKGAILSLTNYLLRMHTRPTPFGLAASFNMQSLNTMGSTEKSKYVNISISSQLMEKIVSTCEDDSMIVEALRLKVNPLHLKREKEVIFLYRDTDSTTSSISKLKSNELIELLISTCHEFVHFQDIFKMVKVQFEEIEIPTFTQFVKKLLRNDFLISNCRRSLSEENPLSEILTILESISPSSENLVKLVSELKEIRSYTNTINHEDYFKVVNSFDTNQNNFAIINEPSFNKWFNIVLIKEEEILNTKLISHSIEIIDEYLSYFSNWNTHNLIPKSLVEFFIGRFGHELVSVKTLVYDSDFYEELIKEKEVDLVNDNYYLLKDKIIEAIYNKEKIVYIDDSLLSELKDPNETNDYIKPNGYELICYLTDELCILEKGIGSNALGKLNGRFLNSLDTLKKDNYQKELSNLLFEEYNENYILAEITCSPYDSKMGNILSSSSIFKYEIPLNTVETKGKIPISLDDLYLGIDNNSFYIWSKSLQKRIIPYQSNSAALNSKLPRMYLFLSKLGLDMQSLISDISTLPELQLPYLPEIRYKNVVVRRAEWKVDSKIIKAAKNGHNFKERMNFWRNRYSVPQIIGLSKGDSPTVYNLENDLHLELLCKELKNSEAESSYYVFIDVKYQLKHGAFSQHIIEVGNATYSPKKITSIAYRKEKQSNAILSIKDNWIYLKIYFNRFQNFEDSILPKLIIEKYKVDLDQWFFVRYKDEKDHIRLRFKVNEDKDIASILRKLTIDLDKLIYDHQVDSYTLDLFEPEYSRYGGEQRFKLMLEWFQEDSEWFFRKGKNTKVPEVVYSTFLILNKLGLTNYEINEVFKVYSLSTKKEYRLVKNSLYKLENSYDADNRTRKVGEKLLELKASLSSMYHEESREIILSLVHMHINRHLGIDREKEFQVYGLVSNFALSMHYLKGDAKDGK
ncbi:thiopeptide-type bacteriocin biosynthesis protein [Marinilactibacillus kalidii]|uniref:thiopeptide-type bacteriocin biosynthesis protein n=1 Tax=Marinilactibacillus kalidii TaxID=2820274 RepID=UPI001ABEA998|nr:thiopeptide-type bacteriocin biosynthesis protein [Marinilactibacillus kalidii]